MSCLSIIIPVYNKQEYLSQCIDSILGQTYKDFELILVDDGSNDCSEKICDDYAAQDSRVIVIHQENQGVVMARVNGAMKSTGKYITFVDSDDWILEDMYRDMISLMETQQVDMVVSGMNRYYNEYRIISDRLMLREGRYSRLNIENDVIPYMLHSTRKNTWELDPSLCSKIFKRELILKHLLNTENLGVHYGDDTSVIFPLVLELDSMYVSHKAYYFHRQREDGAVAPYIQDEDYFDKLYRVYQYLKEKFMSSEHKVVLKEQLDHFYLKSVRYKQRCYKDVSEGTGNVFPFWEIPKGSRVVLYGAGEAGCHYMEQNERYHFCEIVAWVDKNYVRLREQGKQVCGIDEIQHLNYDYIVIAIQSAGIAREIKKELIGCGVMEEKILWSGVNIQKIN